MSGHKNDAPASARQRPPMHGPMAGMIPPEKPKNFGKTVKRLLLFLRPQKYSILLVMLLSVISVVFTIASPKILGSVTDELFGGIVGRQISQSVARLTGGELPADYTKETVVGLVRVFGGEEAKAMLSEGKADRQRLSELLEQSGADAAAELVNAAGDGELLEIIGLMSTSALSRMADMLEKTDFVPGQGINFEAVARILLLLLFVYAAAALFMWLQQFIIAGVAQRTVYNMRKMIDEKLTRLPLKYFDSTPRGEILSRITNDADNIAQSLQQSISQIITVVFTVIGVLGMMFFISTLLSVITLCMIPLSILATMGIARRSQKLFREQWKSTGRLNSHIEESYTGHQVIRLFSRQKASLETFDAENNRLFESSYKAQFISGIIMPMMQMINNLNYVIICVVGGVRGAAGQITLGDVQAFIQYSRQFNQPITQMAGIVNILQSTVASAERVFELLDAEEQLPESGNAVLGEHLEGGVEFHGVSFRYKEDVPLIEDMRLSVRPGQTVAIVGPTGAGKTTLVNLLMRFYEIKEGSICIDGTDIRSIPRERLREKFGMVLQDTWLFGGTIRENIAYGKEGATEEEIVAAARAAYADHFIKTLSGGYEATLTDDATNISQGQRQLLTIARAFLSDPDILILDEATSSVDTRTEVLIQKAMTKLMHGRTNFVIAHRLSTIRDADIIVVMNEGRIVEQGSHGELLAQNGFYAQLYNAQFAAAPE